MGWISTRTDPRKNFTIYVDGDEMPGDVEYVDPNDGNTKILKQGAAWSQCSEPPDGAVGGTRV